ncbi:hypothetical protein FHR32_003672 [Streptosporangium album]|uniref:DUF2637 domain-containing protein n=1 Tax=Streptosporangium album TaxID=47479 RepID=A0A7W7RWT3_9ACTN|nr:DUF2637 domain-containing protein [Streptosporangium album]MBB4939367.1 hypothetical protein [Streptosporangium album]
MDAKSPAAADLVSRPSSPLPPPAKPDRLARTLRGAGIAVAGVCVAALTAAACVLSFEDLRVFALAGEAGQRLAYLYPAAFDALLAVAMIGVLLLRGGRWPVRLQAGVVLTLLFVVAAAAEVTTATRTTVDVRQAAVVVAVAPWAMLAMALWLWLLLIKHAAARRTAADAATAGHGRDIVPFSDADVPTAEYPAHRDQAATPATDPAHRGRPATPAAQPAPAVQPATPAAESVQPVPLSHAEVVLDPQAAPPLESAPHHDLPSGNPVVGPTAAPETPEIEELPKRPASSERPATTEHLAAPGAAPGAAPESAPQPPPLPEKPVRWGDLVRPRQGDLLVHPPRAAVQEGTAQEERPEGRVSERVETWDAGTEASQKRSEPSRKQGDGDRSRRGEVGDRDVDTQPIPTMSEQTPEGASPDPAHGAEAADREESLAQATAGSEPQVESAGETDGESEPGGEDTTPPPSTRVRSTPTPPEE